MVTRMFPIDTSEGRRLKTVNELGDPDCLGVEEIIIITKVQN